MPVSSLFLSCVLCACDLLIVLKLWHLRAGYPASNLKRFLKRGATRIYTLYAQTHTNNRTHTYTHTHTHTHICIYIFICVRSTLLGVCATAEGARQCPAICGASGSVTGVDNRSHQTRVNGYQFVLAVARVALALFAPMPCAPVTVCDHPTPCASVTVCDVELSRGQQVPQTSCRSPSSRSGAAYSLILKTERTTFSMP